MGATASRFILLVSAACILFAVVALYGRSAIIDRSHFADRAVATLGQDEVKQEIAVRFTDGVLERSPGLVTLRPALESAANDVAAGPWFAARFGAGMGTLHHTVFAGPGARPSLHVPGMATEVQHAMSRRTPVLATRLPADTDPSLLSIGGSARERALLRAARRADGIAATAPIVLGLGLLGLLLVALAAPDRRRGVWGSGLALAAVGGFLTAAWMGARTLTLEGFDTSWGDAVVRTIWNTYLGDLRLYGIAIACTGIVIAAAARPEKLRRFRLAQVPGSLRGVAALAAGVILLADRDLALDLAAAAAAGVLLYVGSCRLLTEGRRIPLAVVALLALAGGAALASGGPAHAPVVAAAATAASTATSPAKAVVSSKRKTAQRPHRERICFASATDARLAAEGAAVPEGAVVQRLSDGRVCVRAP